MPQGMDELASIGFGFTARRTGAGCSPRVATRSGVATMLWVRSDSASPAPSESERSYDAELHGLRT